MPLYRHIRSTYLRIDNSGLRRQQKVRASSLNDDADKDDVDDDDDDEEWWEADGLILRIEACSSVSPNKDDNASRSIIFGL